MKKIFLRGIAVSLVSIVLFGPMPGTGHAISFSDVEKNNPHFEAIDTLNTLNIIKGYEKNIFKPQQKVNRAEMLVLVMKGAGISADAPPQTKNFSDVLESNWFFPYVRKAMTTRLITGYADNTFRPTKNITVSEGLAIIFKANNTIVGKNPEGAPWYGAYMDTATKLHLISRTNPLVDAQAELTRAQAAELIFRMKKIVADRRANFDITGQWNTLRHEGNFYQIRYPADWQIFKGTNHAALWKLDQNYNQRWFTHTYPQSARLTISLSTEPIDFAKTKADLQRLYGTDTVEFLTLNFESHRGFLAKTESRNVIDFFINLSNGKALVGYAEYGESPIGDLLREEILEVVYTFQFVEKLAPPALTPAEKLAAAKSNILVEGKGLETLQKFPDRTLLETDAIGVGTGPIDYYYSAEVNSTLKYERAGNVILNIKDGKTNAF